MNTYNIEHFDNTIIGKNTIVVQPNTVDDSTSLNLYGYGYKDYGDGLLENMVHLMENFCSESTMPKNPTEGQLWYKRGTKELLLFMGDKAPYNVNHPGWRNIIPKSGWDSSDDSNNTSTTYLTSDNFEQYLSGKYLTSKNPELVEGELTLKNTWVTNNTDGTKTLKDGIANDKATSKLYVDSKIEDFYIKNIKPQFPVKVGDAVMMTATQINTALKTLDDSSTENHLYIRNNSTNENHRTMKNHLILYPNPTVDYNPAAHSNYAATMGWVKGIIGTPSSTPSGDFVKKSGDTMVGDGSSDTTKNGALYLVDDSDKKPDGTYSDTNGKRAATRAYVDNKFNTKEVPPALPSDPTSLSGLSYVKMPDGTLIIYGYVRNFDYVYPGFSQWYQTINPIVFPISTKNPDGTYDGCPPFINDRYVVTISSTVPEISYGGKIYKSCTKFRAAYTVAGKVKYDGWFQWRTTKLITDLDPATSQPYSTVNATVNANNSPALHGITFESFEKTTTQFMISGMSYQGLDQTYIRNFLTCDFTAIGRWK